MTKRDTMQAIKALGLTVRHDGNEYRVNYPKLAGMSHDREATAYYTDDAADALDTAKAMALVNVDDR
jgi:hypothetical protein